MLMIGMTAHLVEKLELVGEGSLLYKVIELEGWELQEEERHSLTKDEEIFKELHLDKAKFKSEALRGHWI